MTAIATPARRKVYVNELVDCYYVPGSGHIIDLVHPDDNAFCKGMQAPDNRMKMEDWFAQLREPISYSNEDIDREAQFADFIYSLVTKER